MLVTILKWHRLILLFGLVLMVAAGVAMWLQPSVASAVAKILVKIDRGAVPIPGLPVSSGRGGYSLEILQTEAELLKSRSILLPVAKALLAERGKPADGPESELAANVAGLRRNLGVTPVPNTSVLRATYVASIPAEAERILGMILDSYVRRDAAAARLAVFFEHETDRAGVSLREAEERLRKWQEANNIVAVESQITTQLARISETENAVRRADADIAATRTQIETLTREVAQLPAQSVTGRTHVANPLLARLRADLATEETAGANVRRNAVAERLRIDIATAETALLDTSGSPLVVKLRTDLVTAEGALHDIRQRYTDEDRRVQEKLEQIRRLQQELATAERETVAAARERLQGLRRELAAAERDAETAARATIVALRAQLEAAEREGTVLGGETVAPNPLRETLARELGIARARLTSLVSQRDAFYGQLAVAATGLGPLREQRLHFERLSREVDLVKSLYLQNTKRLDEARVAVALENEQFSNVAVIEPPVATVTQKGQERIMEVTLLAALVGIGLGMATAFALEFFNPSLRTPDDVEFYLGVPVLATVPALPDAGRSLPALPPSSAIERRMG